MPTLVIPAAGAATRFDGWSTPKPFLPFRDSVMLNHVRRMFPKDWRVIVGLRGVHRQFFEEIFDSPARAFYVDQVTRGPAETVALALDEAAQEGFFEGVSLDRESVVVCDCDTIFDARARLPEQWRDGVVAMRGCTDTSMSYVERSMVGNLRRIHEKPTTPPSDEGVVGIYSFETVNSFFNIYAARFLEREPGEEWFMSRMLDFRANVQGHHVDVYTVPEGSRISTGNPMDYLEAMAQTSPRDLYVHDSWSSI